MASEIFYGWYSALADKQNNEFSDNNSKYYRSADTGKWTKITAVLVSKDAYNYCWKDKVYVGPVIGNSFRKMTDAEAHMLNKQEKGLKTVKGFAAEFAKYSSVPDAQEQAQAMTDFADGKMTYAQMRELCG